MILTLKPPQCITRFHKRPRLLATASLAPERAAIRKADKLELACPVCLKTFCNEEQDLSPISGKSHFFTCSYCKKGYSSSSKGIIDLTIPSSTLAPIGTSFFQNPVLAFTYDRGYRDLFWIWNFPGYDEEFRMAEEIMKPRACGEIIMDLSCGTGSFTRRFLSSKSYKAVVAADYSESMLEQCHGFLKTDKTVDISKVILLRADAARLPFASNSLAAVHSGAAIHCWPQPSVAVAEVARVLRPGGVFVASTFMFPEAPSPLDVLINPIRQMTMELQLPFKAWTTNEIRSIVKNSGLVNWTSISRGRFILFSAMKAM